MSQAAEEGKIPQGHCQPDLGKFLANTSQTLSMWVRPSQQTPIQESFVVTQSPSLGSVLALAIVGSCSCSHQWPTSQCWQSHLSIFSTTAPLGKLCQVTPPSAGRKLAPRVETPVGDTGLYSLVRSGA